ERVEIAGHDDGLLRRLDQVVELPELEVAVPVLQREVHEEDREILQLQLDDEALDARIEIVERLAAYRGRRQEGVALLADDGQELVDRALAVLDLVGRREPEVRGDLLRLVHAAAADRA